MVPEWQSKAITVNAIEKDRGESSRDVQQGLSEWTLEGEGKLDGKKTTEEESPAEESRTDMETQKKMMWH